MILERRESEQHVPGEGRKMIARLRGLFAIAMTLLLALQPICPAEEFAALLPPGVKAVWSLSKASRERTETRERVCLNGLWRWQPARVGSDEVPGGQWGYFKVPGCWPGITDYMQKESQTLYAHPTWKDQSLRSLTAAWHERELSIPGEWAGRRIALSLENLNSYAAVYVDGKAVGEIQFPGGELDITPACQPGSRQMLSMLVIALPLKGVMLSYTDSNAARQVAAAVPRRGLCGDVYLVSTEVRSRISDVKVDTSVRKQELRCTVALRELVTNSSYFLRARILKDGRVVRDFRHGPFLPGDLKRGQIVVSEKWMPDDLWDTHTPQNSYHLEVSLLNDSGKVLDTYWSVRFGFREFWIEGRDFFLNGTRIFLSAVPLDNAEIGAALATYDAARESFERLKTFGINTVYTHNYGCEPGAHLSFAEILRAADDTGMLVGFSQPHFSHYEWQSPNADEENGYARHAESYVRTVQNHPSVVMYSMSHNATGYEEDMNPDLIDGLHEPRDTWSLKNARLAVRAEAIVNRLDASRVVYHHAGGNIGAMHTVNFYPNFAPAQELSDWFGHWASTGVKPVFTCEYGAPFTWDWTMYRGWFKGEREFGSAKVPWEFCLAEWNAQFLGDVAFKISDAEKANLRWEAQQFRAGKLWHRWDYPNQVGSSRFEERYPVMAQYLTDNWRAFRTWGVSGISPWEHEHYWKLREGVDKRRIELTVDWENLQQPGFSPDFIDQRYERMDVAFTRADWIATPAAEALLRNNRPLLAYLGGKPAAFTSNDHNFFPGETVEKQIIVINNSRRAVTASAEWWMGFPKVLSGRKEVSVATGQQARIGFQIPLPESLAAGKYKLSTRVRFSTGEVQEDTLSIDVLARPHAAPFDLKTALFDPKGETARLLDALGIRTEPVGADADLSGYDVLVVGKGALTTEGPGPDVHRVRDGLKVIVFEQSAEVLEKRLGFRVQEYGLRQLFPRLSDHPLLAGLPSEQLRDWRGEATLIPPRLKYELRPRYGPTVRWCDIPVPHLWRCGNRGNVASVLIEKPGRGDFMPVVDGGYGLQYSPLLEYREGEGVVLFCQVDVTGRSEMEPAAEKLARNVFQYIGSWKPLPRRSAAYIGESAGEKYFESMGVSMVPYEGAKLSSRQTLLVGPGAAPILRRDAPKIVEWLKAGGNALAIHADQDEADSLASGRIQMKVSEHISAYFAPFDRDSLLAGVCPADVHNRDPRALPLVNAGARIVGNGVLANAEALNLVFCQLAPWEFDGTSQANNLKRTRRRVSFLLTRLMANMGVSGSTPILERLARPIDAARPERRWAEGLYSDMPEEWDDPYRFFRW